MIDPQARRVLDLMAEGAVDQAALDDAAWVAAYREQLRGMRRFAQPDAPADMWETAAGHVPLRVYRAGPPVLVWFHGGGFIGGGLDTHDAPLRALASRSGWTVVSVAYGLAPEAPFPRAHEDCFAAVRHVAACAAAWGLDPRRLAVGGDSCGGLLAASVAMMARDRSGPPLCGFVALYPNADLREDRDYSSLREHDGKVVKLAELHRGLRMFMAASDRAAPCASPALAPDLGRLPPAYVATCEADPLRDEGELLARRLAEAGVRTEHVRHRGMIHGVFQMAGAIDAADQMAAGIATFLDRL